MTRKRNNGKPAESEFESVWTRLGKRAWCYRLADKAEIFGRNRGRGGNTRAQPCDFLVVYNGQTEFAEIKSSQDPGAFRFSQLRTKQDALAAQVVAAGGSYVVYVLHDSVWYRLPWEVIQTVRISGKASLPWTQMEAFAWQKP